MNPRRQRHAFKVLIAAGSLLPIGYTLPFPCGHGAFQEPPGGVDNGAGAPSAGWRPERRMRTSLSLPYFSFAQSLTPRS
ncbi:hypothetical protein [Stenotrophomonas mori]|uniref:Secreted protein n=1 Tax=Stenotrophomonas mori TaxID=2871096 RepID=A0ABT0SE66_9GAMM|nr:hypothetical protein [Stenotrophomonas mori]MCL7713612.1 hypothetical protein [Stenotrophomonas mori]